MERKVSVRSNKRLRTFTLKVDGSVYKTERMSKEEFEQSLYNTDNDWLDYLKTSSSYTLLK